MPLPHLDTRTAPDVLEAAVQLAVRLVRRETPAHAPGTLLTLGDANAVVRCSRHMEGLARAGDERPPEFESAHLLDPTAQSTIERLSPPPRAIVVRAAGQIESIVHEADDPDQTPWLPPTTVSAVMVTRATDTIAIAVPADEDSIRLFHDGRLVDQLTADAGSIADA